MTLPHGWIEVHGWPWGDGMEDPPQRMLFQVRHLLGVVWQRRKNKQFYTTLFVPGIEYSHVVEESMAQVQELMAAALAGQEK